MKRSSLLIERAMNLLIHKSDPCSLTLGIYALSPNPFQRELSELTLGHITQHSCVFPNCSPEESRAVPAKLQI